MRIDDSKHNARMQVDLNEGVITFYEVIPIGEDTNEVTILYKLDYVKSQIKIIDKNAGVSIIKNGDENENT